MPLDLTRPDESLRLSDGDWGQLLELAKQHGWKSAGTEPPDDPRLIEGWPGTYLTIVGQRVSDADAARLSAALTRALPDLSDEEISGDKWEPLFDPESGEPITNVRDRQVYALKKGESLTPQEWFSGTAKGVVLRAAAFAARGGFSLLES